MRIGKNQFLFTHVQQAPADITCSNVFNTRGYTFFLGEDCLYTRSFTEEREIILLGYCVNADKYEQSCQQMCDDLLAMLDEKCTNVPQLTKFWGGRWVVFAYIRKQWYVWNDACGLKQCFCQQGKYLSVGSQARYLGRVLNMDEDEAAAEFMRVAMRSNREYSMPVYTTGYREIVRLLPNHIWDQAEGKAYRMKNILPVNKNEEASRKAAEILRGAMRGAVTRKPLAVTVTAGWDSRIVLAACETGNPDIKGVTLKYVDMTDVHPDIQIAKRLTTYTGISHQVSACTHINDDFLEEYCRHSENAHSYWVQMAQQTRSSGFGNDLWVKGACNEILRNPNGVLYNWQVNAKILCGLFQLPQTEYSRIAVNNWLKDARPYCKQYRIRLLDLFYWEHRMGSWLAECLNEADVISDMFSPFNIRAYLEIGYRMPWKQRIAPNYMFFEEILRDLNPGCLEIPINGGRYQSLKSRVKLFIKNHMHLIYGLFLMFYHSRFRGPNDAKERT